MDETESATKVEWALARVSHARTMEKTTTFDSCTSQKSAPTLRCSIAKTSQNGPSHKKIHMLI